MIAGSLRDWQMKIFELQEAIKNMELVRARSAHSRKYEAMRFFRREKRFLETQLLIAEACVEELERQIANEF